MSIKWGIGKKVLDNGKGIPADVWDEWNIYANLGRLTGLDRKKFLFHILWSAALQQKASSNHHKFMHDLKAGRMKAAEGNDRNWQSAAFVSTLKLSIDRWGHVKGCRKNELIEDETAGEADDELSRVEKAEDNKMNAHQVNTSKTIYMII